MMDPRATMMPPQYHGMMQPQQMMPPQYHNTMQQTPWQGYPQMNYGWGYGVMQPSQGAM